MFALLTGTYKNVNVTTIMFLMSGDLTGLCLYIISSFNRLEVRLKGNDNCLT